jgi:hypothetical protein
MDASGAPRLPTSFDCIWPNIGEPYNAMASSSACAKCLCEKVTEARTYNTRENRQQLFQTFDLPFHSL